MCLRVGAVSLCECVCLLPPRLLTPPPYPPPLHYQVPSSLLFSLTKKVFHIHPSFVTNHQAPSCGTSSPSSPGGPKASASSAPPSAGRPRRPPAAARGRWGGASREIFCGCVCGWVCIGCGVGKRGGSSAVVRERLCLVFKLKIKLVSVFFFFPRMKERTKKQRPAGCRFFLGGKQKNKQSDTSRLSGWLLLFSSFLLSAHFKRSFSPSESFCGRCCCHHPPSTLPSLLPHHQCTKHAHTPD